MLPASLKMIACSVLLCLPIVIEIPEVFRLCCIRYLKLWIMCCRFFNFYRRIYAAPWSISNTFQLSLIFSEEEAYTSALLLRSESQKPESSCFCRHGHASDQLEKIHGAAGNKRDTELANSQRESHRRVLETL